MQISRPLLQRHMYVFVCAVPSSFLLCVIIHDTSLHSVTPIFPAYPFFSAHSTSLSQHISVLLLYHTTLLPAAPPASFSPLAVHFASILIVYSSTSSTLLHPLVLFHLAFITLLIIEWWRQSRACTNPWWSWSISQVTPGFGTLTT